MYKKIVTIVLWLCCFSFAYGIEGVILNNCNSYSDISMANSPQRSYQLSQGEKVEVIQKISEKYFLIVLKGDYFEPNIVYVEQKNIELQHRNFIDEDEKYGAKDDLYEKRYQAGIKAIEYKKNAKQLIEQMEREMNAMQD